MPNARPETRRTVIHVRPFLVHGRTSQNVAHIILPKSQQTPRLGRGDGGCYSLHKRLLLVEAFGAVISLLSPPQCALPAGLGLPAPPRLVHSLVLLGLAGHYLGRVVLGEQTASGTVIDPSGLEPPALNRLVLAVPPPQNVRGRTGSSDMLGRRILRDPRPQRVMVLGVRLDIGELVLEGTRPGRRRRVR